MSDSAAIAGFVRGADALLRALGAATVVLRIAVAGGPSDGLGLAPPLVEELTLAPAAVRRAADAQLEVLLSASAVRAAVEERGLDSADALFALALRLVHAGRELRILRVQPDTFAGSPYLFRILVAE
jgi:hypothetical protein